VRLADGSTDAPALAAAAAAVPTPNCVDCDILHTSLERALTTHSQNRAKTRISEEQNIYGVYLTTGQQEEGCGVVGGAQACCRSIALEGEQVAHSTHLSCTHTHVCVCVCFDCACATPRRWLYEERCALVMLSCSLSLNGKSVTDSANTSQPQAHSFATPTRRRVGGAAMGKLHEIARNSASAAAARACVNSGVGVDDRVCLQLVWPILLSPFSWAQLGARAELLSFLSPRLP
jgi:hypothetical protein